MTSRPLRRWIAPPAALVVALMLLSGLGGGLLRAGVVLPDWAAQALPLPAPAQHAALMIAGFLGTVIGIERAVALKWRPAWAAPLLSALGALALLGPWPRLGAWALVAGALVFVVASALIVQRQRAAHTVVLGLGALSALGANLMFALGRAGEATLAAWFGFLVLTIAAERLEMTRLMRRRPAAQALFFALVALMLAATVSTVVAPRAGGLLYGFALLALAIWLVLFDIARRTLRSQGLSRYMAACLLTGYAWLGVAGAAWAAMAVGLPARDAALHALGLGFILSMVMGHAPVILPAITGLKVHFSAAFYAPLALLHGSLLLRLLGGAARPEWRSLGATLNALAIAAFALTVVAAVLAWQRRNPTPRSTRTRSP